MSDSDSDNVLVGSVALAIRQPGDALAEWSDVQKYVGDYSARLYKGGSGNAGSTHLEVIPPTGKTLQSFLDDPTDYSFRFWYSAVTGYFIQYELRFEDPDSDGWIEVTVVPHQALLGVGPTTGWQQKSLALTDSIGYGGIGETGASFFDWDLVDTIAEVVSGPNGKDGVSSVAEWELARVRLELWEPEVERTAYVDSLEIDGVVYTVEPGGTGPAMKLSSPYRDIGYTDDGVTLNSNVETEDTRVDEEAYPIGRKITSASLEIVCNMAESSLANLEAAMAGAVRSGNVITLGSGVLQEMSLRLTGKTPGGFIRTYYFPRVTAAGSVGMSFTRTDKTIVPVTFQALKPNQGSVGTFVDNAV